MLFVILYLFGLSLGVLVNPLPKPKSIEWSGTPKVFSQSTLFEGDDQDGILIQQYYQMIDTLNQLHYFPVVFDSDSYNGTRFVKWGALPVVDSLSVVINQLDDVPLKYGVNESYHLEVNSGISIEAETVWGALNALKTLQQLIVFEDGKFYIEGDVDIWDEPIYSHRGLMIDTARNFIKKEVIKTQIDLMSLTKMNILHWHLIDTQSWPIELVSYPVVLEDSYSFKERFSQEDIKEVIQYAYKKGIRVIPELDLPGHSNSGWKKIDPKMVACGDNYWQDVSVEPPPGQLDIAYEGTYEILETVYDELNSLFPDDYFHVGHDELNENCYNQSDIILDWYEDNDSNFTGLLQHWIDKSLPIFSKNDTNLIMWQDIVSSEGIDVPKNITLQIWLSAEDIKDLTSQGYDVIVSVSDHYYLDCGFGGWVLNDPDSAGSWCDPYKSWQNIYSFDFTENLTSIETGKIKGAEVPIWSEMVDSTNLISKTWSRAGAFAEVVWSGNKDSNDTIRLPDMTPRIFNFREYLVAMGHNVDPFVPKYCVKHPEACYI